MAKKLHRTPKISFKGTSQKAEEDGSVIRGIVIIQEFIGEDVDAYGDNFDDVFLNQLVKAGNEQSQGVKSRFGHPNACGTALGSYLGRFKEFRIGKNEDGKNVVLADLHLSDVAKDSPNFGNIHDYVLRMSREEPDMIGNSIVYIPDQPEEKPEKDSEGNDVKRYYQRLSSFLASDIVDSPAATESLFKSKDIADLGVKITEFLDENPEIFSAIEKDESLIVQFLTKYFTNKKGTFMKGKSKSGKKPGETVKETEAIINNIETAINGGSESKSFETTTAGGQAITVSDEDGDGMASVGDVVTDTATGDPIVSQEIEMTDGTKVVTDETGTITEVVPASSSESAGGEEQKDVNTLQAKIKSLSDQLKDATEKLSALQATYEKDVTEVSKKVKSLEDRLQKMRGVKVPPSGEQKFNHEDEGRGSVTKEAMQERKKAYGKKKED